MPLAVYVIQSGIDPPFLRSLLAGIIIGIGVGYACFRVGYLAGLRQSTVPRVLIARDCNLWLDGEPVDNVGNVWIERAHRQPPDSASFYSQPLPVAQLHRP